MIAWHFLESSRTTRWNNIRVEVGQTIRHDGELVLCNSGLHASVKALDAFQHAPGPILCRVKLGGKIIESHDKIVASERTCLAMNDATETLRYFARYCAISATDYWDAPDVVLDYLMTGDESIKAAAGAAAWAAAGAAAWAAAGDAARAAAGDAARAAAWAAARDAAGDAAWDAAWAAARAAAGDAVRAAARAAQEEFLTKLFQECVGHK